MRGRGDRQSCGGKCLDVIIDGSDDEIRSESA